MKIVDLKEKEAREEAMPTVIENDFFKLEMKNGHKIESANIAIKPLGAEMGVSSAAGSLDSIMNRTVEALVTFATVLETQDMYEERDIDMVARIAKEVAKRAVAEMSENEDGSMSMRVEVKEDK